MCGGVCDVGVHVWKYVGCVGRCACVEECVGWVMCGQKECRPIDRFHSGDLKLASYVSNVLQKQLWLYMVVPGYWLVNGSMSAVNRGTHAASCSGQEHQHL